MSPAVVHPGPAVVMDAPRSGAFITLQRMKGDWGRSPQRVEGLVIIVTGELWEGGKFSSNKRQMHGGVYEDTHGYDPPWVVPRVQFSIPTAYTHTPMQGYGCLRVTPVQTMTGQEHVMLTPSMLGMKYK
ncbi:hypothetical protein BU15DRAFT_68052 [Melanogaster broomeanus]|nr:hypothetical protein BU15DRAFT_68052 [Melanogaster broomeanus]